jgi:hypothetical protein
MWAKRGCLAYSLLWMVLKACPRLHVMMTHSIKCISNVHNGMQRECTMARKYKKCVIYCITINDPPYIQKLFVIYKVGTSTTLPIYNNKQIHWKPFPSNNHFTWYITTKLCLNIVSQPITFESWSVEIMCSINPECACLWSVLKMLHKYGSSFIINISSQNINA